MGRRAVIPVLGRLTPAHASSATGECLGYLSRAAAPATDSSTSEPLAVVM